MTAQEAQSLLDRTASQLAEYFGSVQIVASRVEPNGATRGWRAGVGDWYARRALCEEFIERDQAMTLAREIGRENPPAEGEEWKQST